MGPLPKKEREKEGETDRETETMADIQWYRKTYFEIGQGRIWG